MHLQSAFFSTLALGILTCSTILHALPRGERVVEGTASFDKSRAGHVEITTSDRAIINYDSFNIDALESVTFVQPSRKSAVLNRVKGGDPSALMGSLKGNGRVYLINQNGILIGPSAVINTGSFIASTLDITNEDFMSDRQEFFRVKGSKGSILHQGSISCPEGVVALISPEVRNEGMIAARAGKVLIAGAEKVTLDFMGDGLLSFSVDGDVEDALFQHLGNIDAAGGDVFVKLKVADNLIKQVVNSDGIEEAVGIIADNGVVRLASGSMIAAARVQVEANGMTALEMEGRIDSPDVGLFADKITLSGAYIDASHELSGGRVLIGGDYKGSGYMQKARQTIVDQESVICADATESGDGGHVIVWAEETTLFNGKIYARGIDNGGFVETSAKDALNINMGFVDATAPQGQKGVWLIDPTTIVIDAAGVDTLATVANCALAAASVIAPATINAALANQNVILCASSTITQNAAQNINMSNAGSGIIFQAGGTITLNGNITTQGGLLNFTNNVVLAGNATLSTIGGGALGAPVTFTAAVNDNVAGTHSLTITAGTGAISINGATGGIAALGSFSATGNGGISVGSVFTSTAGGGSGNMSFVSTTGVSLLSSSYTATGGAFSITGNVTAYANVSISTTTAAAASITGAINPDTATKSFSITTANGPISVGNIGNNTAFTGVTLIAGTNTVAMGSVGTGAATGILAGTLVVSGTGGITLNGGTYNTASSQSYTGAVTLAGNPVMTSGNTAINFSSTINGAKFLEIDAGTNAVTFSNSIGAVTPLQGLVVSAAGGINFSGSTYKTVGSQTYTGPVVLNTAATAFNVIGAGGVFFSSTVNTTVGAASLTIDNAAAGAINGDIIFLGNIGTTVTAFGPITLKALDNIALSNMGTGARTGGVSINVGLGLTETAVDLNGASYTVASLNCTGEVILGANVNIDANGGGIPINITGNIDGDLTANARNLTCNAPLGTIVMGAVGINERLGTLSLTGTGVTLDAVGVSTINPGVSAGMTLNAGAGSISLNGGNYITSGVTGGFGQSYTGAVILNTSTTMFSTNQPVTFSSTVDTSSIIAPNKALNIEAGTSTVVFNGKVGDGSVFVGTKGLLDIVVSATGGVTVGGTTMTAVGNIYLGANAVTPVNLANDVVFSTTDLSGGAITINGNINSSVLKRNLTFTAAGGGTIQITGSVANAGPPTVGVITFTGTGGVTLGSIGTIGAVDSITINAGQSVGGLVLNGTTYNAGFFNATGNTRLGANVTITSGAAGPVTINGSIDSDIISPRNLTITGSTTAAVTVQGAIGSVQPLGAVSITTTTGGINLKAVGASVAGASTLTVTSAGGTVSLNGGTYNIGGGGFLAPGVSPFVIGIHTEITTTGSIGFGTNTIRASAAGFDLGLNASGTITTGSIGSVAFAPASILMRGTGGISLGGGTYTSLGQQSYTGALTLSANSVFTTTNAPVTFSSTVNDNVLNTHSFSVAAGTGAVSVGGAIGGAIPFASVSLAGDGGISVNNITTGGAAGIQLTSVAGIVFRGTNYTVNGIGIFTAGGNVSLTTDVSVSSAGGAISFSGTVDNDGGVAHTFAVASSGGDVLINGASGTEAPLGKYDVNAGAGSININNIGTTKDGAVLPGADALSLTASKIFLNGGIYSTLAQTFTGAVAVNITTSLISNNNAISFTSTVDGAQGVTIDAGTSTVTFAAAVGGGTALKNLFVSGSTVINVNTTTVTTTGEQRYNNNVTLGANATFTTTNSPVTFIGTVNGNVGGRNLTVAAGNGSIRFASTVGQTQALGVTTLTGEGGIVFTGNVSTTAGSAFSATGDITLAANTTFSTGNFTVIGTVDSDAVSRGFSVNSGAGFISIKGDMGTKHALANLTLTAGTTLAVAGVGTATAPGSLAGFNMTAPGGITLNGGGYITQGSTQAFSSNVILATNVSAISTNQPITFSGAIDGVFGLTMQAGSASIIMNGVVGGVTPLSYLTTQSTNVFGTAIGSALIKTTGSQTYTGVMLLGNNVNLAVVGTGNVVVTSHINGNVAGRALTIDNGALGSLTGSITIGGNIGSSFATAIGAVTMKATGGILLNGIGVGIAGVGAVNITAGTGIRLDQGTYRTGAFAQTYTGDVVLATATTFTTAARPLTINGNIDGIAIGAQALSANTANGNVVINGDIGATTELLSMALNVGLGTITLGNVGSANSGIATGLTLTSTAPSTAIFLNGGVYNTTGAQQFSGNVQLNTTASLISAAGGVTFNNLVDGTGAGTEGLTINAAGAVNFASDIGSAIPVGSILIQSASSVTSSASITASSFVESGSTGSNSFSGPIATSLATGIVLKGGAITFAPAATVTTTGGGIVDIVNTGLLTIDSIFTVDGSFTQSGGGLVNLGGNITTSNSDLTFTNAVTLTNGIVLSSGPNNGNIHFISTVDGAETLSLLAGTGTVFLDSAVGSGAPLTSLTTTGLETVQTANVTTVGNIIYLSGLQLSGNLTSNTTNIAVAGDVFLSSGSIWTAPLGNITLGGNVDGTGQNLQLLAVGGTVTVDGMVGAIGALNNLIVSAVDIFTGGIGGTQVGVSGALTMIATNNIDFTGRAYIANNPIFVAGGQFNMVAPTSINITSWVGPINFSGGPIDLTTSTSSPIFMTNGGDINLTPIIGNGNGLLSTYAGTGVVTFSDVPGPQSATLASSSKQFVLGGDITAQGMHIIMSGDGTPGFVAMDNSAGNSLTSTDAILIDALTGSVGTPANPIILNGANFVVVGATGSAYFVGTTGDGTVHCLPSNPPFQVFFNGELVCGFSGPPPFVPSQHFVAGVTTPYSSYYNTLSNDRFFFQDRAITRCEYFEFDDEWVRCCCKDKEKSCKQWMHCNKKDNRNECCEPDYMYYIRAI